MADRYYAMAEAMNTRGAMEMAVPFYRQAVALLLAERESLHQQLGEGAGQSVGGELPLDDLHGLLEAAEALGQPTPAASMVNAAVESGSAGPSLEDQIAELASELGKDNGQQVIAGLMALEAQAGVPLPAKGLALRAKAHLSLGQMPEGVKNFEAALALEPGDVELQINTGAARLAAGEVEGALELLRGVWQLGLESLEPAQQRALLRNLAAAEGAAGHGAAALQLRLKWFQRDGGAVPLARWLGWAEAGLRGSGKGSPEREAALALLEALQQAAPEERSVLQARADALEDQGDYREAALLYRHLLRPQTT